MRRVTTYLRGKGIDRLGGQRKTHPGYAHLGGGDRKGNQGGFGSCYFHVARIRRIRNGCGARSPWQTSTASGSSPCWCSGDEDSSITLRLVTRQFVDLRGNEKVGLNSLHQAVSQYLNELKKQFDVKVEAQNITRETGIKANETELSPGLETGNDQRGGTPSLDHNRMGNRRWDRRFDI